MFIKIDKKKMKVEPIQKPVIVFQTPFYTPTQKTFSTDRQLQDFLTKFSFMRPHEKSSWQTGFPEFRLGTQFYCRINGVMQSSLVQWGPRIIIAKSVRQEGDKIYAVVPMDSHDKKRGKMVEREMREVQVNQGMYDAVINSELKQLWPVCERGRTALSKFFTTVHNKKLF